mmetsp:Transcript_1314/g.3201  ORF Transcript_1314/g.3201 Transcript_1314/m.3201 type:complete len:397 (+) Transcript_1314:66-1256(+)
MRAPRQALHSVALEPETLVALDASKIKTLRQFAVSIAVRHHFLHHRHKFIGPLILVVCEKLHHLIHLESPFAVIHRILLALRLGGVEVNGVLEPICDEVLHIPLVATLAEARAAEGHASSADPKGIVEASVCRYCRLILGDLRVAARIHFCSAQCGALAAALVPAELAITFGLHVHPVNALRAPLVVVEPLEGAPTHGLPQGPHKPSRRCESPLGTSCEAGHIAAGDHLRRRSRENAVVLVVQDVHLPPRPIVLEKAGYAMELSHAVGAHDGHDLSPSEVEVLFKVSGDHGAVSVRVRRSLEPYGLVDTRTMPMRLGWLVSLGTVHTASEKLEASLQRDLTGEGEVRRLVEIATLAGHLVVSFPTTGLVLLVHAIVGRHEGREGPEVGPALAAVFQ